MDEKTIARFWEKVDRRGPDECWEWTAARSRAGYGKACLPRGELMGRQRNIGAHRRAWELTYGHIPDDLCVLHKCDNRACCNPGHLFLGTQLENIEDMRLKGRARTGNTRPGEESHHHKATDEIAREVRRLWSIRPTQAELAKRFGVSQGTISNIVRGKHWGHVK